MKNLCVYLLTICFILKAYYLNENDKVSFSDYTDWDMEDRDRLGEQITKLDSLNGEIQTEITRVKLQYENSMNVVDQYLAELKHKYKNKEIQMIKDHFGIDIGGNGLNEKRQNFKNKLKEKLRKLAGQTNARMPPKKDVNSQIEEYNKKTVLAQTEIENLEKQIQELKLKKKEEADQLKQSRLDHFDKLRKIRDSEAIASDGIQDILKSQKYMMGGPLTEVEFKAKKQNFMRKGKPWIEGKIGLNQRAEIHDFREKYKRRNQKEFSGFKFADTKKQTILKDIHHRVQKSIKRAFKDFKKSFVLLQINQKITI